MFIERKQSIITVNQFQKTQNGSQFKCMIEIVLVTDFDPRGHPGTWETETIFRLQRKPNYSFYSRCNSVNRCCISEVS